MFNRAVIVLLYLSLGAVFFWQINAQEPFVQLEMATQSTNWTLDERPYLTKLFDPSHNGHGDMTGRFRYVEYIAEGIYWNVVSWGFTPSSLIHYFNLYFSLIISFLLYWLCKKQGLKEIDTFLIVSLFLLSSPTYMVILFNYRMAKTIASLLIVSLLLIVSSSIKEPQKKKLIRGLSIVGVLTDPFFIVLCPLIAFAWDLSQKTIKFYFTKQQLIGFFYGGLIVAAVNAGIGRLFNPDTRLLFHIPLKPTNYFKLDNLFNTPDLLPDFFGPLILPSLNTGLGWAIFFILFLGLSQLSKKTLKFNPYVLLLGLGFFVTAYIMNPESRYGQFASYYGHPLYLFFLLAIMSILTAPLLEKHLSLRVVIRVSLVGLIFTYQIGKQKVFETWRKGHINAGYISDYRDFKKLRAQYQKDGFIPEALLKDKQFSHESYLGKTMTPIIFKSRTK